MIIKKRISEITKNNTNQTEEKEAKLLGQKLFNMHILIKTIKNKTNDIPNLPFSKSLSDKVFYGFSK